jgi:hypothetical protein
LGRNFDNIVQDWTGVGENFPEMGRRLDKIVQGCAEIWTTLSKIEQEFERIVQRWAVQNCTMYWDEKKKRSRFGQQLGKKNFRTYRIRYCIVTTARKRKNLTQYLYLIIDIDTIVPLLL